MGSFGFSLYTFLWFNGSINEKIENNQTQNNKQIGTHACISDAALRGFSATSSLSFYGYTAVVG